MVQPIFDTLESAPSSWRGSLALEYSHHQGGTQVSRAQVQAPLKVQRPFYPEGAEVCHSIILHTAGGVVGGDRLALNLQLHPQAQALITTAAATKIYRSSGATAHQSIHMQVAERACLEWLPQETIVFSGAKYRQQIRVDLAPQALWLGWDITRFGRSARGEQFLAGEWRSRTEVWQDNQPLWIDPQWLQGGSTMLTSAHGLAGCSVVGTFALVGRTLLPEWVTKARLLWDEHHTGQVGVTRLMSGVVCRYRGSSSQAARRWFTDVWNLLRLELLARPACKPRVW